MNRIASLYRKDLQLGIKDVWVLLEVGFAIVVLMLLLLVLPEDIETEAVVYIYDDSKVVENFIVSTVGLEEMEERKGEYYVDSRREVVDGMVEDRSAIGLVIGRNNDNTYDVELLTQPYTTATVVEFIAIDLEDLLALIVPPYDFYPREVVDSVRVTSLQVGLRDELPFNQRLLPPILLMMVGILGLFIMMSVIGQERMEATIRAFRISPAGMWEFLLSKHLLLLTIGFTTFSILYLPVMGFSGYLPALVIVLLTVLFGSSLGVILGGIFDTPVASMLFVLLLMLVLGLPAISLFSPAFSPAWIKFVPSYHTLFGLDAAMFPDDNRRIIWQSAAVLGGLDVILLPFSAWLFGTLIRKEN